MQGKFGVHYFSFEISIDAHIIKIMAAVPVTIKTHHLVATNPTNDNEKIKMPSHNNRRKSFAMRRGIGLRRPFSMIASNRFQLLRSCSSFIFANCALVSAMRQRRSGGLSFISFMLKQFQVGEWLRIRLSDRRIPDPIFLQGSPFHKGRPVSKMHAH